MKISTFQLSNSDRERLALLEAPIGFPTYISLTVHIDQIPRNIDIPGILHLYEHMMFNGIRNMSEENSMKHLSHYFYETNAYTLNNRINLSGYMIDTPPVKFDRDNPPMSVGSMDAFGPSAGLFCGEFYFGEKDILNNKSLSILHDMMFNPNLNPRNLEKEKKVVVREIEEKVRYEICSYKVWSSLMKEIGVPYSNEIGTEESVMSITRDHLINLRDNLRDAYNRRIIWTQTYQSNGIDFEEDPFRHVMKYPMIPSFSKEVEVEYENDIVLFLWNMNHIIDYKDISDISLFRELIVSDARPESLFNILRNKGYIYGFSVKLLVVDGNVFLSADMEAEKGKGKDLLREVEDWNASVPDYINIDLKDKLLRHARFREAKERYNYESSMKMAVDLYGDGVSLNDDRVLKSFRIEDFRELKKFMGMLPTYSVVGV